MIARNTCSPSPEIAAHRQRNAHYYSPKGPFLSEPQDSTHSVRFSKFDRFELLVSLKRKVVRPFLSDRREPPSIIGFQFTISRFESSHPRVGV